MITDKQRIIRLIEINNLVMDVSLNIPGELEEKIPNLKRLRTLAFFCFNEMAESGFMSRLEAAPEYDLLG